MDRRYRLREKADFQRVRRRGSYFSSPILAMYAYPNGRKLSRFGIVTGKKIGKAVVRNKTKRRIKESIGSFLDEMQQGVDVLFVARPSITSTNFAKVCSTVEYLFGRAGLFRPSG